jgi:CRISPR/Cas system-associated exonuclease Cas4 (RecB family)
MKHGLSKSTYIKGLQCPKALYLYKNRYFLRDPMPPSQQARLNRGSDVGELARSLFPEGIDVSPASPSQIKRSIERTAELLQDENTKVIYEATFKTDNVVVMNDILVRDTDGWIAYEVKSSLKVSQTYKDDIALQFYVIEGSGLQLKDISILYLNNEYRLEKTLNINELLKQESLLDYAREKREEVKKRVNELLEVANLGSSPAVSIGPQCNAPYPCEFRGHCWKGVARTGVLQLSQMPEEERFQMYHSGVRELGQVVPDDTWSAALRLQLKALLKGSNQYRRDALLKHFAGFNTSGMVTQLLVTRPAIPLFPGNRPFHPVPVGFACLRATSAEQELLLPAPKAFDPPVILQQWISICQGAGSILCWDAGEMRNWLTIWSEDHPGLSENLSSLSTRLIDIRTILEEGWFAPFVGTGRYDMAAVAEACGAPNLNALRISDAHLAGEIIRPMITGGRQVKGYELKDIEEFLSVSALSLMQMARHLGQA